MIDAYIDDSGHVTNGKVLLAFGFIAPVGQWKMFENDWRAILRMPQFDLDYLHMREFRAYRGKFAKFKDNLPLQADLFSRLYDLLERRAIASFGCTVLLKDYERVNDDFLLRETFGHPFAIAGCATINKALDWMHSRRPGDRIKFVFDRDTDGWGDFLALSKQLWGTAVVPMQGSFKKETPLQAADHVAWELHRFANAGIDTDFAHNSVKPRGSLAVLMERFQPEGEDTWLWANENELRNMCKSQAPPGPTPRRVTSSSSL